MIKDPLTLGIGVVAETSLKSEEKTGAGQGLGLLGGLGCRINSEV